MKPKGKPKQRGRRSRPELLLLLNMGMKPLEIHKEFGFPRATCYYYGKQYEKGKIRMKELLQKGKRRKDQPPPMD